MKTTLDIPDELFKKAKITAISHGISLRQFVSEALEAKLSTTLPQNEKPWMKLAETFPRTPEFREEIQNISKIIENEFERIDEEDWK